MTATARETARAYFPRGLVQPEGSFRFSADALLLASFVLRFCLPAAGVSPRLLELGCGCGVLNLACLLERAGLTAHGLDVFPELLDAAARNAAMLGLGDRFSASVADLEAPGAENTLSEKSWDIVAANPPFRILGKGRLPRSEFRRRALFAGPGTLPAFVRCAARVLRPEGSLALVYAWEGRAALFQCLEEHGLAVRTLMPVSTTGNEPSRCLVRAVPGRRRAVRNEATLALRDENGYTPEALAFCPWLGTASGT